MQTLLSLELVKAYRAATYSCFNTPSTPDSFHIDQPSPGLAEQLRRKGVVEAVYLTAYNPRGEEFHKHENVLLDLALLHRLTSLGHVYTHARSEDVQKLHVEEGFVVWGMSRGEGKRLGTSFGQNAIVWIEETGTPGLVLLR